MNRPKVEPHTAALDMLLAEIPRPNPPLDEDDHTLLSNAHPPPIDSQHLHPKKT